MSGVKARPSAGLIVLYVHEHKCLMVQSEPSFHQRLGEREAGDKVGLHTNAQALHVCSQPCSVCPHIPKQNRLRFLRL